MLKKYLTAFDNDILYDAFKNSKDYITPNVSLIRAIKQLYFEKSVDTNNLVINGEIYTDKVITLAAGGTYEISGVHEGQIVIDAISVKPDAWTTIILDNATIVSDESYGILYDCPQSSNKGYQGLTVTLTKDSQNFVICNKETTVEGDETYASIDSWKDLTIQGVGYLAVYNNIAHGLRGETLNIAGPHIYINVEHDGIHGKTVNAFDGVFYFQQAKDAFGTTETGKLNIFGGSFDFINVTQDHFDSKNTTKLGIYNVAGELPTNMVALEDYYNEGTVIAYRTKTDYEEKNGVVIEPSQQTIKEVILYNANSNGQVVAQTAPTGYTVPVVSKDSNDEDVILIPEQQMYVIGNEYNIVEVTGKITAPIVRPTDAIILDDIPSFSKKGKLNGGYDNNFDIYLNGAVIVTNGDSPSIANLPDAGRVKIIAVKETINAVINKYNGEGTADHDAIKSENNLPIEVKNESILYVTSVLGDGVDGGETTFTDSKGTFIASGCGERGVKGNAIVIGPNAQIDTSIITSYITDPNAEDANGKNIYTTFDGIFIAKNNVKAPHEIGYPVATTEDPDKKTTGYADVFARNGKASKGVFGTTDAELKGVAIIGSIGAAGTQSAPFSIDCGSANRLYVNQILHNGLVYINEITTVQEEYKVIPYKANPISKD